MVQIVGKYKHASNAPGFESFMKDMGIPEAKLSSIQSRKPTITISENNGQWTFHGSDAGKEWSSTFKLGEAYDEQLYEGDTVKSVTRREGDKLIFASATDSKDNRVFEFNEGGLTVHIKNPKSGKSTSITYTRL